MSSFDTSACCIESPNIVTDASGLILLITDWKEPAKHKQSPVRIIEYDIKMSSIK
jgi:hypothetical protein